VGSREGVGPGDGGGHADLRPRLLARALSGAKNGAKTEQRYVKSRERKPGKRRPVGRLLKVRK
jgi:hypothetical protein